MTKGEKLFQIARAYLVEARADYEAVAALIQIGRYNLAVYHAQQAVEKLLKACLAKARSGFINMRCLRSSARPLVEGWLSSSLQSWKTMWWNWKRSGRCPDIRGGMIGASGFPQKLTRSRMLRIELGWNGSSLASANFLRVGISLTCRAILYYQKRMGDEHSRNGIVALRRVLQFGTSSSGMSAWE